MNSALLQGNMALAWIWILVGFISGMALGLGFHQEEWIGGYSSFRRRLFRLAHISFFGLALINLLFYFTVKLTPLTGMALNLASAGFMVGALAMPICCVITACRPALRMSFSVPVVSLMFAAAITVYAVIK